MYDLPRGNFNKNKIRNLDMVDFCKKSRTGQLLFFLAHILTHGFCVSVPGSGQPPITFFFQM
jgi:hypothetical protein